MIARRTMNAELAASEEALHAALEAKQHSAALLLANDLWTEVLLFCAPHTALALRSVCRRFHALASDRSFWLESSKRLLLGEEWAQMRTVTCAVDYPVTRAPSPPPPQPNETEHPLKFYFRQLGFLRRALLRHEERASELVRARAQQQHERFLLEFALLQDVLQEIDTT